MRQSNESSGDQACVARGILCRERQASTRHAQFKRANCAWRHRGKVRRMTTRPQLMRWEKPLRNTCALHWKNKAESACKPGSVLNSHSSRPDVAVRLKQPTREQRGPRQCSPIWSCSEWGLPCHAALSPRAVRSYRTVSPLPRMSCDTVRRFIFCCTVRRLAPPRRYLALCPMEPGLSSKRLRTSRLSGRLRRYCTSSSVSVAPPDLASPLPLPSPLWHLGILPGVSRLTSPPPCEALPRCSARRRHP